MIDLKPQNFQENATQVYYNRLGQYSALSLGINPDLYDKGMAMVIDNGWQIQDMTWPVGEEAGSQRW